MLDGQPQAAQAMSAGLQWGARSDDEEEVGAPGMDGYTSSNDSYGGHMGGFAFEGAVSEADPYEADFVRWARCFPQRQTHTTFVTMEAAVCLKPSQRQAPACITLLKGPCRCLA